MNSTSSTSTPVGDGLENLTVSIKGGQEPVAAQNFWEVLASAFRSEVEDDPLFLRKMLVVSVAVAALYFWIFPWLWMLLACLCWGDDKRKAWWYDDRQQPRRFTWSPSEKDQRDFKHDLARGRVYWSRIGWKDWQFHLQNHHTLLSVFSHHLLHPTGTCMRILIFLSCIMLAGVLSARTLLPGNECGMQSRLFCQFGSESLPEEWKCFYLHMADNWLLGFCMSLLAFEVGKLLLKTMASVPIWFDAWTKEYPQLAKACCVKYPLKSYAIVARLLVVAAWIGLLLALVLIEYDQLHYFSPLMWASIALLGFLIEGLLETARFRTRWLVDRDEVESIYPRAQQKTRESYMALLESNAADISDDEHYAMDCAYGHSMTDTVSLALCGCGGGARRVQSRPLDAPKSPYVVGVAASNGSRRGSEAAPPPS